MRFEDYVATSGQSLVRYAYLLTGDHYAAEDLAQTTLALAYQKWRRVSRADDVDAYVRRMATNAYLDAARRLSFRERPTELRDRGGAEPGDHATRIVEHDNLRRLLNRLSARARTVIVMRYYLDMDDHAIAETLQVTQSTVRATASRALAALRDDLAVPAIRGDHRED